MNRYASYGRLDDVPEPVGDAGFNRLDLLTDPALLPERSLARSENLRFDARGTSVRGGIARQFPAGTSVGTLRFVGIYKPDLGDDQHAIVLSAALVLFRSDTQTLTSYPFPSGITIGAGDKVFVLQAGVGAGALPQLYILRGLGNSVLVFDGSTVAEDPDFQPGDFGLFYQDRIAANATTQSMGVSDFLDFTSWNVLNQFQIDKGGDDYLVLALSYQKDYVLVGSRKGWTIAFFDPKVSAVAGTGYEGNLADNSFLRQLTREAGPIGPRAALEALGYIWFITDNAIYAFAPQLDNQLTVLGQPISADIQPIMDRMSAKYARNSWVERYGYRLYFGLAISDEPVPVTDIEVTSSTALGLELPFDLPANLTAGTLATVTTSEPHGLNAGDRVALVGVLTAGLNGTFLVATVLDAYSFTFNTDVAGAIVIGTRATAQRIATRPNRIAVYNLNNKAWESVDTLPSGFYADWARVADYGAQRRLYVYDQTAGPALYEQGEVDETSNVLGGLELPFDLPSEFSAADFGSTPIRGELKTRAFRWGAFARLVREMEVRATLDADSQVTATLQVLTPNHRTWAGTRDFVASEFTQADAPLRKQCGERGLEAQVVLSTNGGRPTFRSITVQTSAVGRVEE